MVGGVSASSPDPVSAYGLSAQQQVYAAWVRSAAASLDGIAAVHGAVNRPLVKAPGDAELLRGLFGGAPEEPPGTSLRDGSSLASSGTAAAMQLCLLREVLATVDTEAE